MITQDTIRKLAILNQTTEFPNTVREYFQHFFLSQLYKLEGSEHLLFKGGTALRFIYGSPRFSEDLDFSLFGVRPHNQKKFTEDLFASALAQMEKSGLNVDLGSKLSETSGGYFGEASFQIYDYPPANVVINVSGRAKGATDGEISVIANDFIPTYSLFHLPEKMIVEEKVFGALLKRNKLRDFYDLYFLLRKGLLTTEQKKRIMEKKSFILKKARSLNFKRELSLFLPRDQQTIIKDFLGALQREISH